MGDPAPKQASSSWRLSGLARQAASFAATGFLVGALLAVAIDFLAADSNDPTTLQTWTLVPQITASGGLFLLSRLLSSRSFVSLALLVALVVVEEAFHVLNAVVDVLEDIGGLITDWSESRIKLAAVLILYTLIALIGLAVILASLRIVSPDDVSVVRNLSLLLIVGGLFGGPLSVVSTLEPATWWLYIEESGEALVFAVMAGYVLGLLFQSRSRVSG